MPHDFIQENVTRPVCIVAFNGCFNGFHKSSRSSSVLWNWKFGCQMGYLLVQVWILIGSSTIPTLDLQVDWFQHYPQVYQAAVNHRKVSSAVILQRTGDEFAGRLGCCQIFCAWFRMKSNMSGSNSRPFVVVSRFLNWMMCCVWVKLVVEIKIGEGRDFRARDLCHGLEYDYSKVKLHLIAYKSLFLLGGWD